MDRRDFLKAGLATTAGLPAAGFAGGVAADARHIYELRTYELRNDQEPARIQDFFGKQLLPALQRAGVGPVGVFTPDVGMRSPSLVLLIDHATPESLVATPDRLAADAAFTAAWKTYETGGGVPYVRYETEILRAFAGHPKTEVPPTDANRPGRLFELRTYEAPHDVGLLGKQDMFNQEEIAIFRASGFAPIFFGAAISGTRLPKLVYMVAFDNLDARMKAWDAFRVNPDWRRISARPGWANRDIVSTTQNAYLRPASFSQIR